MMMAWKLGPALATGNAVVLKPSEFTPLTALYMTKLIKEAGFPAGVVNVLVGYGHEVGAAIAEHPDIDKVAFTGSTLVGRKIQEASARTNLKDVTLELGGKSPNVIFNDADMDLAVNWTSHGIFWNHGQACCAGSRIFVQEGIYDKFLDAFTKKALSLKLGDPFANDSYQGPQVSQLQYDVRNLLLHLPDLVADKYCSASWSTSSPARMRARRSPPVASVTATRATGSSPRSSLTRSPTCASSAKRSLVPSAS